MTTCSHAERVARAALSAVVEPARAAVMTSVRERGPVAVWQGIRAGDAVLDPRGAAQRRSRGVDGEALLATGAEAGVTFVCPGDPNWPEPLDAMNHTLDLEDQVPPPFGLWIRGTAEVRAAVRRSVAVVGSRTASRYGEQVSADLGADLALAGWIVVSGAAYGIDAAAHRGSLALGGTTIAVLACGADVAYPSSHADLLGRVAESGLVISELPPGTHPTRSRFLARNRIIAGLTRGTVVVEAALRSGALSTANWAAQLNREVLAVPGPVTSALSAGCHDRIRKGSILVTDAAEVVDALGELGADAVAEPVHEQRPLDAIRPDTRFVYEAILRWEAVTIDDLVRRTGFSTDAVRAALRELNQAELVVDRFDGWRVAGDGA